MNKSEAIRQIIAEQPGIMPKEIHSELAKQGITASRGLVDRILYGRPKPQQRPIEVGMLLAAKAFVKQAGSIDAARKSLDMLATLVS